MCFVAVGKAYDSVDRTLLWTVLAQFGVSLKRLAVIRHAQDGMCARTRAGDVVNIQTGLARGRAYGKDTCTCHCCFNMFVPAVLRAAVERLSANEDVVKDMVSTKVMGEKGGAGGVERLEKGGVWRSFNRSGE